MNDSSLIMELKVIVISLAYFSLLMPPALGSLALAKAAAFNALKGASLIGAGLAFKGKAALLAVQGLAVAIKGLLANAAAQNANLGAVMLQQRPVYYPTVSCNPCFPLNPVVMERPVPNLFDIMSGAWSVVRNKVAIAGQVLQNMNCPPVVEYISRPNFYPLPTTRCLNQFKRK